MVNYYYYQSQAQDLKISLVVFQNTDASHHAKIKKKIYVQSIYPALGVGKKSS